MITTSRLNYSNGQEEFYALKLSICTRISYIRYIISISFKII